MPIIRFATNISQTVHLRSLEGRQVDSQFGGSQWMFQSEEGNFYVSEKVGPILMDQFAKLGVKAGDAVEITKAESGSGPGRKTQWIVATSITVGEQVNGTLAVPATPAAAPSELEQQLAQSIRMIEQRKQAQQATSAAPAWANFLVDQTNAMVDAYAAVLRHSARHEGLVKGDDVRSIFLSAFINVTKGGKSNAA